MNYIHQIKGFWITQEMNQLGTSEIAMYFYLLEVWNKTTWAGSFKRNNSKVMADLSIKSYKTLQSVRDRLQSSGILSFKQRNGDPNVEYIITDLSKIYLGYGEGSGKGLGKGSVEGRGKVNINETKPNETKPLNPAGGEPPGEIKPDNFQPKKPEEEKEKKPPRPKKEKEVTAHWKRLVEVWFTFYHGKTSLKPTFDGPAAKCMQTIANRLESMATERGDVWTEKYATDAMLHFFTMAYNLDDWLRANFMLPNLCSKFDAIINPNNHGHPKNGTNGKPANGAKATSEQLSAAFAKFHNQS